MVSANSELELNPLAGPPHLLFQMAWMQGLEKKALVFSMFGFCLKMPSRAASSFESGVTPRELTSLTVLRINLTNKDSFAS